MRGQRPRLKALLLNRDAHRARCRNNASQAACGALAHRTDLPAVGRTLQLPLMSTDRADGITNRGDTPQSRILCREGTATALRRREFSPFRNTAGRQPVTDQAVRYRSPSASVNWPKAVPAIL